MPELAPFLGALALASLIVLISTSFSKMNKVLFQATLFGAVVAAGLSYLISNQDPQLINAWNLFITLTIETRFCLSLVMVGLVYFGGAMYISAPEDAEPHHTAAASPVNAVQFFRTPASVDNDTTFKVPEELPEQDHEFFENMLDK